MTRSSRSLALFAALALVAVPVAVQAAPPNVSPQAAPTEPKRDVVIVRDSMPTLTFALTMTETFDVDSAHVAAVVQSNAAGDAIWGQRAQRANQKAAFDKALEDTFRHGAFSPDSFSSNFLHALVDYAGPENVREFARSLRLPPNRYRVVLHALDDADLRNRFSDS